MSKRIAAIVVALMLALGTALFAGTGPASAAPSYNNPPRITCVIIVKPQKFIIKCHLTGYRPKHKIRTTLHTKPIVLGTPTSNANGTTNVTHDVPLSFAGQTHTVIGQDTTVAKDIATTTVKFPKKSTGGSGTGGQSNGGSGTGGAGTNSGGTGGLSATGVAVMTLGGVAFLMLVAGGVFLYSGRRRNVLA